MLSFAWRTFAWFVRIALELCGLILLAHLEVMRQFGEAMWSCAWGKGEGHRSLQNVQLRQSQADLNEFGGCIKL